MDTNNNQELHHITAIVENRPGVMQRVASMFSRRGFNMDNLSVGPTDDPKYSRMTITVKGDPSILEQVVKQLNKLIPIIKVRELPLFESIERELGLIKVKAQKPEARNEITQYVEVYHGTIVDVTQDSMIIEVTGDPEKLNSFVKLMAPYGIREIARTGVTAMHRGQKAASDSVKQ